MNISLLKEAFQSFSAASKSIESYYEQLQRKIDVLTLELERKNLQLNNALADIEKANDYLNAVLHSIEEAIIVFDGDERVSMINKSAERFLHLVPDTVKGKSFNELGFTVASEGADTFLMVNGRSYNVIVSSSSIVDYEGAIRGKVILIKDISRLRELEVQFERNQRLISMGEMAAKIVHEIRNPLCSIELYSSMLEAELENREHKELAAGISKSISNLNNILTNMSIFARTNKPSMKPVRLDMAIDDCIQMVMPLIKSSNVKIERSFLNTQIEGDAELLKQVFLNLIINAVQSKLDGSTNHLIEIIMRDENNFIIVDIRDNGIGIQNEHIEKIFDPFFSTKESGTGLGLSISTKIMQSHNGYIKVVSEHGRGSCFRLYFKKMNNPNEKSSVLLQFSPNSIKKRGFNVIWTSKADTCSR